MGEVIGAAVVALDGVDGVGVGVDVDLVVDVGVGVGVGVGVDADGVVDATGGADNAKKIDTGGFAWT